MWFQIKWFYAASPQDSRGYVYLPKTLYFYIDLYLALNKSQYWKSKWKHAHGSYALQWANAPGTHLHPKCTGTYKISKSKDPDNHLNLGEKSAWPHKLKTIFFTPYIVLGAVLG